MRGYPQFNFPAFDGAAKAWRAAGWEVVNPAELDREAGFDGNGNLPEGFTEKALNERDIPAIKTCQAIALLPGWGRSRGVMDCEAPLVSDLGLLVFDARYPVSPPTSTTETVSTYAGFPDDQPSPDTKPTNPKDLIGSDKLPLHLWPVVASAHGCLALLDGMLKYGRHNWRKAGVRTSIYIDAAFRHLVKYWEGQDADPDSGLDHRAHALACIAITLDAEAIGKLTDDRAYRGEGAIEELADITRHVARLRKKHAGRNPKHYVRGCA
jgi:hypothetical protein